MPFSKSNTRKFRTKNPQLFTQIKASFEKIIQIDPKGERDRIQSDEALVVAVGVGELKSLANGNPSVKTFFDAPFGTFEEMSEGQRKKPLLTYLNDINTDNCGATTIHTLREPWAVIELVAGEWETTS